MTAVAPDFRVERCVRYRYRYSECRRCADACPHDAIGLTNEGVDIDVARCQNCALCSTTCRTGALVAGNLDRVGLLKRAIKSERFSVACAPSGIEADAVVPCLGALDAAMLAYLGKRGIATELRGNEHCARCPHGATGAAQFGLNLEGVAQLERSATPEAWRTPRLAAPETARDEGFRAERRQFFRRIGARGLDGRTDAAAYEPPAIEKAIRPGKWFVPEMRELLQIVCKRADAETAIGTVPMTGRRSEASRASGASRGPRPDPIAGAFRCTPHPMLPLMDIELAGECTTCEACFRACPTGAIQIQESDADWLLTFRNDRCVACGLCEAVCQPHVLRARGEFDAAPGRPAVALYARRKQRCVRCDRFFVSLEPGETCAICAQDEGCFAEILG